jgi:hypothetical protein
MKKRKRIPKRMLAIANLVDNSKVLADVGCDHAYISINLLENGKAERIIASDLREGPLNIARDNIKLEGFEERIETRLCAGLCGYEAGEVDTILISGMGGMLVKEILSESIDVVRRADTLILEPQSDLRVVRAYLKDIGFEIIDEDMLSEGGKYYQIMKAVKSERKMKVCDDIGGMAENEFGPILIKKKHPVLLEFLKKRKNHYERLLQNKSFLTSQSATNNDRIAIIENELNMVKEALIRINAKKEIENGN